MKIAFEEHPDLAKDTTLFLHGNLGSTLWWQPTLQAWREFGSLGPAPLVFVDLRGCGKNQALRKNEAFNLENVAGDVLELVESLKSGPISLVGHGLGGLVALKMMTMAPNLVSRSVLLDAVGVSPVVFEDSIYNAYRQMAANFALTRVVVLGMIREGDMLPEDFKRALAQDAFKAVGGAGLGVVHMLKTLDLQDEVAKIKTPTLLLHGRYDEIVPLTDSENTAKLMSAAQLEIVEAGHCWNIERPTGFAKRIRRAFQ